jgi:hypothetical protein
VEFFFHYAGTGGRTGANPVPNWFFYWSQAMPAIAGVVPQYNNAHDDGNGNIGTYRPGVAWATDAAHRNPNFVVYRGGSDRGGTITPIMQFAGIYYHERQHHLDFVTWWPITGIIPANFRTTDTDGNLVPDSFEPELVKDAPKHWHDYYSQPRADKEQQIQNKASSWNDKDFSDMSDFKHFNRQ